MKILFFIGTLSSGGKERRLLELITFLKAQKGYELVLVTKQAEILFENFYKLNVKNYQLSSSKLNLSSFFEFKKIVSAEKPDVIHAWGNKYAFMSILIRVFYSKIKILDSEITSAPPSIDWGEKFICNINFLFSDLVLSNSYAGIEAFRPPIRKSKVIYNGLNMKRFENLEQIAEIKQKFNLCFPFTVIMVASYSQNKDYVRFFEVGKALLKYRKDTLFLGVGYYQGGNEAIFENCISITKDYPSLRPMEGTSLVESLVNVADLGVLFSPNGEGLSNSILEYMALGKPVIANDAGGTKEIVRHNHNGYLITDESPNQIAKMIHELLEDPEQRRLMGKRSKQRILEDFSLDRMGKEFEEVYHKLIENP
ncbi:glycosyltransferase family 4 protein [Mongoliitalea daihaiensis]|uniref:glycosyltransferase family 4 protein n=1 Tax=Mongoliitalea daihaiensis TaxID=2782006 RepID=UPI001F192D56|nr:glycosyltransferase family 4 protein [Mongoliitalea daihaiensis]UJP64870.1 glycosyltransferase family 4 protein [Mongoliitalea daihaiensis]